MTGSSSSKASFFKQSGWMVIATFLGGVLMMFVHTVARTMGKDEYAAFYALLKLLMNFTFPAVALQTVFTRQMAVAAATSDVQMMAISSRAVAKGMTALWLVFAVVSLVFINQISVLLDVPSRLALVFVILTVWVSFLAPVFKGLLQGEHRFGSLGSLVVIEGVGRFGLVCLVILVFHHKVAGATSAVFMAQGAALVVAIWLTRKIWLARAEGSFDWKLWLGQFVPLALGIASFTLMSNSDMPFVNATFHESRDLYAGGQAAGFALVQFIAPVTSVMFPRIVQSMARGEKTNALALTVGITVLVGVAGAVFVTLFPKLPLYVMYHGDTQKEMLKAAPLVPLYVWVMIPITVSNVLVLNLLARSKYSALPWLIAVPILYFVTLKLLAKPLVEMDDVFNAFRIVIFTVGGFGTLLCGIAAWFTWRLDKPDKSA